MRKVLLYIVYGNNQGYYDGAKFSFLSFLNWVSPEDSIETVVLTEKPELFIDYPVTTLLINKEQIRDWSLDGSYHFRIKNRGLAYVIKELKLNQNDKVLFFDTDTYFHKSPLKLFDLIYSTQALFYLNEGLIYNRDRFNIYVECLEGIKINVDNHIYELSKESSMWGSLMIGIMPSMTPSLEWADKLMLKLIPLTSAHTVEPFALSESLLKKYKLVEGKNFVSLYSTSRKKEYAVKILSIFFLKYSSLPVSKQIKLTQKTNLKRPFWVVIRQRLLRLIKA